MTTPTYPKYETHAYATNHSLQTLFTCLPRPPSSEDASRYWVIYIHGGAWRDPLITSHSFQPALSLLLSNPTTSPHIAGYASIDYRLSPHPSHPQDRASTPPAELRNAWHPDHIRDVLTALAYLQRQYGFGEKYLLVGHSCGATMAFQTVMGASWRLSRGEWPRRPRGIVGVEGVYDLRALRDSHKDIWAYQEFLQGAFGRDERVWEWVGLARQSRYEGWREGKAVVLAHSRGDEMVEEEQVRGMHKALEGWEEEGRGREVVLLDELRGGHDEVWEMGEELAICIQRGIELLVKLDVR